MTLVAVVALILAVACGIAGWLVFGQDMTVNVISGLMELLLGVAVAVFIVDRLERRHRRREWTAAYAAINGLLAAAFVDVMRLLFVQVASHYAGDKARYPEFLELARFHCTALRSAIEGFATVLEPDSHRGFRSIEFRLSWLTQKLSDRQVAPAGEAYLHQMQQIAADITQFLSREADPKYTAAHTAARSIAGELWEGRGMQGGLREAIANRYVAQTRLLQELDIVHPSGRYIFDDIDNDIAVAYFALDHELLSSADSAVPKDAPTQGGQAELPDSP